MPWAGHLVSRWYLGAAVLMASQASCILVGYDGLPAPSQSSSDGGGSVVSPDAGADVLAPDGSAPKPSDSGVAGVDAAADATTADTDASTVDTDASTVDTVDGSFADASTDANTTTPLPDANMADVGTPDPPIPGCTGTAALGLCWHLGPAGLSCDESCDTYYGGFDQRTIYYTGKPSEGAGSLANCKTVLLALGVTTVPIATYRPDGLGLGCHVRGDGSTIWLDDRQGPFDAGDSLYGARRACACAR